MTREIAIGMLSVAADGNELLQILEVIASDNWVNLPKLNNTEKGQKRPFFGLIYKD